MEGCFCNLHLINFKVDATWRTVHTTRELQAEIERGALCRGVQCSLPNNQADLAI